MEFYQLLIKRNCQVEFNIFLQGLSTALCIAEEYFCYKCQLAK